MRPEDFEDFDLNWTQRRCKKRRKRKSKVFHSSSKVKQLKHQISGKSKAKNVKQCYRPKRPTNRQLRRSVNGTIEREKIRLNKQQRRFNNGNYTNICNRLGGMSTVLNQLEARTKQSLHERLQRVPKPFYDIILRENRCKSGCAIDLNHPLLSKDETEMRAKQLRNFRYDVTTIEPILDGECYTRLKALLQKGEKPELFWHGTNRKNLPNIKKIGLVPGGTNNVPVLNGVAYGRGTYVAYTPLTSSTYAAHHGPDGTILLCAAFVAGAINRLSDFAVLDGEKNEVLPLFDVSISRATTTAAKKITRVDYSDYYATFLELFQTNLRKSEHLSLLQPALVSQSSITMKGQHVSIGHMVRTLTV